MTLDSTPRCIDAIRQAEQRHGRPTELGKLDIIVTPTDGQSPDMIRRYQDLGVDCVVALPADVDRDHHHAPVPLHDILRTIETLAAGVDQL